MCLILKRAIFAIFILFFSGLSDEKLYILSFHKQINVVKFLPEIFRMVWKEVLSIKHEGSRYKLLTS